MQIYDRQCILRIIYEPNRHHRSEGRNMNQNRPKTQKNPWKRRLFHALDVLARSLSNFLYSACIHLKDGQVGLHYLNRTERNGIEWVAFVRGTKEGKRREKTRGKSGNVSVLFSFTFRLFGWASERVSIYGTVQR